MSKQWCYQEGLDILDLYPPGGGCDGGGGITGDGDLRLPPPEQSRTVYYDQAHYLPVPGGV